MHIGSPYPNLTQTRDSDISPHKHRNQYCVIYSFMKGSPTPTQPSNGTRLSNFANQLFKTPLTLGTFNRTSIETATTLTDTKSITSAQYTEEISGNADDNLIYFHDCERTINEVKEFNKKLNISHTKHSSQQTNKLKLQIVADAAASMKKLIEKSNPLSSPSNSMTSSGSSSLSYSSHPLQIAYDNIMKQIDNEEKVMIKIQELYSMSKDSMLAQSDHLKSRLVACIKHNRELQLLSKKRLDESKKFADKLTKSVQAIKDMQIFYDEITALKSRQESSYVPWAIRNHQNKTTSSQYSYDKHQVYKHYRKMIKAKKFSLMCLVFHNKEYEHYSTLTKNAELALNTYNATLEKMGFNPKVPSYFADNVHSDNFDEEEEEDDDSVDEEKPLISDVKEIETESLSSPSKDPLNDSLTVSDDSSHPIIIVESSKTVGDNDSDFGDADDSDNAKPKPSTPVKKLISFGHILVEEYDHCQCADCSVVSTISMDACQQFKTIYQQSFEAAKMLQRIEREKQSMLNSRATLSVITDVDGTSSHP